MEIEVQTFATRGVSEQINQHDDFRIFVNECLMRFVNNDWGDTDKRDAAKNDKDIFTARATYLYDHHDIESIWIESSDYRHEGKRYVTVMFPNEW